MARRFHVSRVVSGDQRLDPPAAHHAKSVLRLSPGDAVELFDDHGQVGDATIQSIDDAGVIVRVAAVRTVAVGARTVRIASALPKGARADWMIEKLSELGVARFTPLATERAVVLPSGSNKQQRWQRLAEEAARQCERSGVMAIDPLTPLDELLAGEAGLFCWTDPSAPSIASRLPAAGAVTLVIGPEGDLSPAEISRLQSAGWRGVSLGRTILRVETAAIVAAVLAMQDAG